MSQPLIFNKTRISLALILSGQLALSQHTPPSAYVDGTPINYVRSWKASAPELDPNILITRNLKDVKQITQYFDGLGKPIQTVFKNGALQTGQTPVDLISPIVYDHMGRELYQYLPYAGTGLSWSNGFKKDPFNDQVVFYNAHLAGQTGETNVGSGNLNWAYRQTDVESSPEGRPVKMLSPGASWVGSNRGIETKYWMNTTTDDVKIWKVENTGDIGQFDSYSIDVAINGGVYAEGMLIKTVAADEHSKQVIEFKDRSGKLILKKVQLTSNADFGTGSGYAGWLQTYYIYDAMSNLRCVIQPEGVNYLYQNNWTMNATILAEQCFRYEYDGRNRMIVKKVPGAGEVRLVYDQKDRPVMTQDANMRNGSPEKWLVTKYTELNQVSETGIWENSTAFTTHLSNASVSASYPVTSSGYEELTRSFYDNYEWLSGYSDPLPNSYSNAYDSYFLTSSNTTWPYAQANHQTIHTKGLLTGARIKILGSSTFLYAVNFYDASGRLIQTQSTNLTGGIDILTSQFSWNGQQLIMINKQQKSGTGASTNVMVTLLSYDDLGRLVKTEKKVSNSLVNSGSMPAFKIISENEYDKLGQLIKKMLAPAYNNGSGLETLNYEYNVRGWLLGVNRPYARDANNANWFGFDLGYDKTNNNLISGQTYTAAQYNGNIAGTVWKSKGDGEKRKFDFAYDAVNRLFKADFSQFSAGSFISVPDINFNVKMGDGSDVSTAYDANGNIKRMQHWGIKGLTSTQIDNLSYTYLGGSNKLAKVEDGFSDSQTRLGDFKDGNNGSTADYNYDLNGNLIMDYNKQINSITYNHLNLPSVISVTGKGAITYTYDASGVKLKKEVAETGQPLKTTLYINGSIYENDQLQFLGFEEGRIRLKPAAGSNPASLEYDYMIKDHLGNVRLVLTEEAQTDMYPAATMENTTIVSESIFYGNLSSMQVGKPSWFNDPLYTTNDFVAKTKNETGSQKIGPNLLLKVMAGDKFHIRVASGWNSGSTPVNDNTNVLSDLLNLFSAAVANKSGGKVSQGDLSSTGSGLNSALGNFLSGQTNSGSKPRAYVSWILLDEQFKIAKDDNGNVVASGYSGFEQVGPSGFALIHMPTNLPIAENGYLYIYTSNESSNIEVFFDNLQVTHIRGPLIEETHYYPFGLTMAGISSKALAFGEPGNKRKFNQGTELNTDFDINLYETKFRGLDPQLGRFWQIDPLAEMHPDLTSYAYVGNNPLRYNDPFGLDTIPTAVNNGKMNVPKNPNKDVVLKIDNGDGSFSYYNYDPSNPDANSQGYVGSGTETTEAGVTVSARGKNSSSSAAMPIWFDPFVGGTEYYLGKTLDKYRLDGYGSGRPLFPGPAQRIFERNFPKGSFGNTRPVNIHIPGTGSSIQAPRYVVSATGQVLKFVGIASSIYGAYTTEQQYANGEISNAHRWTNHAMTVVSYLGPGGIVVSLLYSAVVEDMIFGNGSSWAAEYNDKIFPAF